MFGFVICFHVCILLVLLVNCVDLLPVQCIYFMIYFRRLYFATVSGVLSPILGLIASLQTVTSQPQKHGLQLTTGWSALYMVLS